VVRGLRHDKSFSRRVRRPRHCEERKRRSNPHRAAELDCFAELVIGPATSEPDPLARNADIRHRSRGAMRARVLSRQSRIRPAERDRVTPAPVVGTGLGSIMLCGYNNKQKEAERRQAHFSLHEPHQRMRRAP
jgi:hypothetical protein